MINAHPQPSSVDRTALLRCVSECLDCAATCTGCADACLGEEDVQRLVRCIRLNLDCADACDAAERILTRQTASDLGVLQAAIQACAHLMWHAAAPGLADRFTVVAADLAGYGASFRPAPAPDHAPHSKRALAADLVQAMAALGHERCAVAGHDDGGRVAYRMAIDHPDRVSGAAVLDVVPTGEVSSRADARLALVYWHWSFLAQPAPLPERLIAADPDAFFDLHVRALGLGGERDRYPADLMAAYRRPLDDPSTVAAICEDYRAGASLDRDHDDADLGRRRIECPLLALWSARGALPRLYGEVLEVWRPWARAVTGRELAASHFLVEDRPQEVVDELSNFFLPRTSTHPEPDPLGGPDVP